MAADGSLKVVIAALGANALIAASKFTAAAWTGSSAMLSEAIHSLADTANQGLLLLGLRRSARPADSKHPFGYAREIYFWSFVVAVLLFSLGAGVSIYEGVHKLQHPATIKDPLVNYVVLGVALVFETISTMVAVREFNTRRQGQGIVAALRNCKDAALFTVVLEDLAALVGLVLALGGIAASHLLGFAQGDALASIAIGLLLASVAAFMSIETKALLIGEAAMPEVVEGIERIVGRELGGSASRLVDLRTMHLGPEDVLVAATLDFDNNVPAGTVEATVNRMEAAIRGAYPAVKRIYIETQAAATESVDASKAVVATTAASNQQGARRSATALPRKSNPPLKAKNRSKGKRRR